MRVFKFFGLLILFFNNPLYCQTSEIIMDFPFGEPGKPVPRGVYGEDNRQEVSDVMGIDDFVRATAVMIPKVNFRGTKIYGYSLREKLSKKYNSSNFDKNVRYLDQPTCSACTGFLIAPDLLITAAHCISDSLETEEFVWLFDYTNSLDFNEDKNYIEVDSLNIFKIKKILHTSYSKKYKEDYTIIQLDRKSNRSPYRFRTSGKINSNSNVNTLGSPTGLPLKFVDSAYVVDNSNDKWFKNDIDTFPGNSGGPVFNPHGFVEGIHVRGATVKNESGNFSGDYYFDNSCDCIKTVQLKNTLNNAGAQAHRMPSLPTEILYRAIYDNIEYAIVHFLDNRLKLWLNYDWIIDHEYTLNRLPLEVLAIEKNNLLALELLREYAKTDIILRSNNELLFTVTKHNNTQAIDYLLVNGINIDIMDDDGNNILHILAGNNSLEVIKKVLEHCEEENIVLVESKNRNNYRPEDEARINNNKPVYKYLKKYRKKL